MIAYLLLVVMIKADLFYSVSPAETSKDSLSLSLSPQPPGANHHVLLKT
jgi:hypothetical protein